MRLHALSAAAMTLALIGGAAVQVSSATAASEPTAHLRFAMRIPSTGQSSPGISMARVAAGRATVAECAVTNKGPATVRHLTLRLAFETQHPDRWRVSAHRHSKPRSGLVTDVGTVRRGGQATVRLYVEPESRNAGGLVITCEAEASKNVRIIQPTIDRSGDMGAALQVRPR